VLYPFIFEPIFKERVWGGREIQRLFGKQLPPGAPIGESWEISDRSGDTSVIANGPLAGRDLRWLMENHATDILGGVKSATGNRFPLLCKILDARDRLSLQVHPPANKAAELGGEPKTEMWFIADAAPGAELYVGLKHGVTRAEFEKKIQDGSVAECFHRVSVKAGDSMFLPSGRVHAIGAGLVIFEIQQNSDTTYRVFDWNRVGLDGKPRELHVAESLASIDFGDFEPKLVETNFASNPNFKLRQLVHDPLFSVVEMCVDHVEHIILPGERVARIIALANGAATIIGSDDVISVELKPGQFCLIPACVRSVKIETEPQSTFLCVEAN
jgi:mannose-6-phosphate isomerase